MNSARLTQASRLQVRRSHAPESCAWQAPPCRTTARTICLAVRQIQSMVRDERPDVFEAHSPYLATAALVGCGRQAAKVRTAFWHADHLGAYVEPALARLLGERAAEFRDQLWTLARALLAPFEAIFVAGVAQSDELRSAGVERVFHVPFGVDASLSSRGSKRGAQTRAHQGRARSAARRGRPLRGREALGRGARRVRARAYGQPGHAASLRRRPRRSAGIARAATSIVVSPFVRVAWVWTLTMPA